MTDNRDSTTPTVTDRVAAGVALLDEKRPGWFERIDLDRLRMDDFTDDVIGQVCGGYSMGLYELRVTDEQASMCGFDVLVSEPNWGSAYADLTAEWKRVISERRAAVA